MQSKYIIIIIINFAAMLAMTVFSFFCRNIAVEIFN